MNWITFLILCLIATGGFIAATYENIAKRQGLPVGLYFQLSGIMAVVGGVLTFGAIILSAFTNPWWTIFMVFIASWFLTQLIVFIFKTAAQLISVALILVGILLLLLSWSK